MDFNKLFCGFSIILVIFFLVSCSSNNPKEDVYISEYVDSSGKLVLDNYIMDKDIIVFINKISEYDVLDIIKARERKTYKLTKDDFYILKTVLLEDYESIPIHKLSPVCYNFFYYYSEGDIITKNIKYNKALARKSLDDYGVLIADNYSDYWIELHKNSENGSLLGVIPPHLRDSEIFLQQGFYTIFPVYIAPILVEYKDNAESKIIGIERMVNFEEVCPVEITAGKSSVTRVYFGE